MHHIGLMHAVTSAMHSFLKHKILNEFIGTATKVKNLSSDILYNSKILYNVKCNSSA